MLNMLNIEVAAYICKYAKYAEYRWGCIYMHVCKYAKYAKYKRGCIYMHICRYAKYAKYGKGLHIYANMHIPNLK